MFGKCSETIKVVSSFRAQHVIRLTMGKIYVKFTGGFGNQLFQYALCLELRERYSVRCIAIHLDRPGESQFLMSSREAFDLINSVNKGLNGLIFSKLSMEKFFNRAMYRSKISLPLQRKKLTRLEFNEPFDTDFLRKIAQSIKTKKNILIEGYFQSPQIIPYGFKRVIDILSSATQDIKYKNLKNSDIVLHVRRGDYITAGFVQNWGVLSDRFYEKILRDYNSNDNDKVSIVTMDEGDVKTLMEKFTFARLISGKNLNWWESFVYMTCGKEFFASNSTFAFWAAHVAMQKGSRVTFPRPWTMNHKGWPKFYEENYIESDFFHEGEI